VLFDVVQYAEVLMSVASSLSNPPTPATPPDAAARPGSPAPLKRSRLWIVYGLLAVIVLGHLVEVVTQREHWPFSPYQMWSKPAVGWEVKREMLRGVTDEPTPREIALQPGQLYPIPYQMVVVNMQTANKAVQNKDPEQAKRIINGLLAHYNNRVAAGKNPGPKLRGLRLYQVVWKMDADASEASRQNPIETKLLFPPLTPEERAAAVPPVSAKLTAEFGEDDGD
jgi:hypothetical protein